MAYIGNTATTQAFTPAVDYFNGDGSTVAFTLSKPVASVAQVQAVIENVPQNPGSAYTVSGNTITFTSAPPSGTANIYVYYTSPITQVIAPSQGTVGTAQIQDASVTAAKLAPGAGLPDAIDVNASAPADSLVIDASGDVGIGTTSPNKSPLTTALTLNCAASGSYSGVELATADTLRARFITKDTETYFGTSASTPLIFLTNNSERMRIDSSGYVGLGTTTPSSGIQAGTNIALRYPAGDITISHANGTASGTGFVYFGYNAGIIGSITQNGTSAVAYNTSSDYRLKENIAPMTGALATVAQLNPVTYTWKTDGSAGQGFIAHELQAVVPDCVTGEKDAVETYVDEEGVEQTRPVYQGIDTSFLVATLTAAIQELKAITDTQAATIVALETRIAALEAQ